MPSSAFLKATGRLNILGSPDALMVLGDQLKECAMSATITMSASKQAQYSQERPCLTVAQLFLSAARRWQRNRAYNALSQLSDRQLEDIGVSRNDIPRLVKDMFVNGHENPSSRDEEFVQDVRQVDIVDRPYSRAA